MCVCPSVCPNWILPTMKNNVSAPICSWARVMPSFFLFFFPLSYANGLGKFISAIFHCIPRMTIVNYKKGCNMSVFSPRCSWEECNCSNWRTVGLCCVFWPAACCCLFAVQLTHIPNSNCWSALLASPDCHVWLCDTPVSGPFSSMHWQKTDGSLTDRKRMAPLLTGKRPLPSSSSSSSSIP